MWVCLLLAVLAALPLTAQSKPEKKLAPYAIISGTVFTPEGRLAPGMKVKIRRVSEHKARWELISDSRGEFAQRIPAGAADYLVWVELKGRKEPAAEAKVHIENDEHQDISLHLTK